MVREAVGELHILRAGKRLVEATDRERVLATHGGIGGVELPRRRRVVTREHRVVLLLQHRRLPAQPRGQLTPGWIDHRASHHRARIRLMDGEMALNCSRYWYDIVI